MCLYYVVAYNIMQCDFGVLFVCCSSTVVVHEGQSDDEQETDDTDAYNEPKSKR